MPQDALRAGLGETGRRSTMFLLQLLVTGGPSVAPLFSPDLLGAKRWSENSNLAHRTLFPSQRLTELTPNQRAHAERAQPGVSTWQALDRVFPLFHPHLISRINLF